jgi:hypothetical protein
MGTNSVSACARWRRAEGQAEAANMPHHRYACAVVNGRGPFPARPAPLVRIFTVGAHAGLHGNRWPFGRLYVGPAGLQVTTAGRRSINIFVPRQAVISVSVGKGIYGQRLKVADVAGAMARVGIEVPFNRRRVVAELRRCGYVVNGPRRIGRLPV